MSNQQERTIQAWLAGREPGAAPDRLRARVADVPVMARGPLAPALDLAIARVLGMSRMAWLTAALIVALVAGLVLVGAALWRAAQPFPPRGLIAYTASSGSAGGTGIRLVSLDGKTALDVSPGATDTYDHSPRWSSDGRTLLFARTSEMSAFGSCEGVGSIVLYDVATRSQRVLATGLRPIGELEWTPAGDRIAFLWPPAGCGASAELGYVDVASGKVTTSPLGDGAWRLQRTSTGVGAAKAEEPRPLTPGEPWATSWEVPSWTGEFVATLSVPGTDGPSGLEVRDGRVGRTVDLGVGTAPSWSPAGLSLAFVRMTARSAMDAGLPVDYRYQLAIASADGWGVRILGDITAPGGLPYGDAIRVSMLFWTSDGAAIYWMAADGGHVVDATTGEAAGLPAAVSGSSDLAWQPFPTGESGR